MTDKPRMLIVGIVDRKKDRQIQESSLAEASLLVSTYGGEVVRVLTQNASHRSGKTYIGSGKVQEVRELIKEMGVEIVIVNASAKTSQLYDLEQAISEDGSCKVWDRTQLILQIFKKHASTSEAKLQIKLAELKHRGPEISGVGKTLSQQGGGIGTRGIGETQTEIMRRHWRDQIGIVEKKLQKVSTTRSQQMKHRRQSGVPTVSIVGYTNAGKTTLFNQLSSKNDLVQDKLFATLDSSVSSMYLQGVGKKIYISDTIGFIQELPTELVEAFRSTLMETLGADLLLHVVDSSDEEMDLKVETVNHVLAGIGIKDKKQIYVLNKVDMLSQSEGRRLVEKFQEMKHVQVSARSNQGIDELVALIEKELMAGGLRRARHLSYLDELG